MASRALRSVRGRTLLLTLTTAAGLGAGAAPAMAATIGGTGAGDLEYTAAAGETNNLRITQSGLTVTFDDDVAITAAATPNAACTITAGGDATCIAANNDAGVSVNLDDLNDQVTPSGLTLDTTESGDTGDDTLRGGTGDDTFFDEPGNDSYSGGGGVDTIFFFATSPLSITLDDQANDGATGDAANNAHSDIEDVNTFTIAVPPATVIPGATLVGSSAANALTGTDGNDALDGAAGNDRLSSGAGDDTVTARDGFADRVDCGPGTDTAVVDTLDVVSQNCETVQSANVGNAGDIPEDRPPAVAFQSPAINALLPAIATNVTLTATDDHGVASVQLIDDGSPVGTDTTAPYVIPYVPKGGDVGSNTLVAVATDTAGQTATALRPFRVNRFAPKQVTAKVSPSRDRRAPYKFRTTGTVLLPTGVTRGQGCGRGVVSVQVKRGSKTISTRRANLSKSCGYSSTVSFANRRRIGKTGRLKITARFLGNDVLGLRNAASRKVRAG